MKQIVTDAIVLARTNYGEADRILTVLTPQHGKVRLLAKGVRKVRSKMAGGIELLSVTSLTYIQGRGQLNTLVSSRLNVHYGNIVKDLERTTFAYEVLKTINRTTEDQAEAVYYDMLQRVLEGLNEEIPLATVRLWFTAALLRLGGHTPNLRQDASGQPLSNATSYTFSFDDMAFLAKPHGTFLPQHIKLLRLAFSSASPKALARVEGGGQYMAELNQLLKTILKHGHIAT